MILTSEDMEPVEDNDCGKEETGNPGGVWLKGAFK